MIDLALAVACSLVIGMIFKHAAWKGYDRMGLLTANYLVATLASATALSLWNAGYDVRIEGALLTLGVVTGMLFIATFFVYALATQRAGMSLAVGVMRVSVVLPFMASWLVWEETPTMAQQVGMALAGGAFFLIAARERTTQTTATSPQAFGTLALLFLAGGLVDVLLKTFDEAFAAQHPRGLFLLVVFGTAAMMGSVLVVGRGVWLGLWPESIVMIWGIMLGIANYGSAVFFLRAVRALPGPFVFPANNIAIVIAAALIGVYGWGEQLNRRNVIGLALATAALLLVNL